VVSVIWQDVVIGIVIFVFTMTIVPMIRHRTLVPWATAIPMLAGSLALAGVYTTLDLWFAVGNEALCTTLWVILLLRTRLSSRLLKRPPRT
jgi:hypothetical protein